MSQAPRIHYYHLFGLVNLAIAQPIYNLVADSPDFLAARQASSLEVIGMLLILSLLVPALLFITLLLLQAINRALAKFAYFVLVCLLFALVALSVFASLRELDNLLALAIAAFIGFIGASAYFRTVFGATIVSIFNLLALVIPVNFLLLSPAAQFIQQDSVDAGTEIQIDNARPVVMLIFDEFSLAALLNEERMIDRSVFPNLARLADDAHWFRNATTVATSTVLAVPAIASGNYPHGFVPAGFPQYPRNIFSLLGQHYDVEAWESATNLCPTDICKQRQLPGGPRQRLKLLFDDLQVVYLHLVAPAGIATKLPPINQGWKNFDTAEENSGHSQKHQNQLYTGRQKNFRAFIDSLEASSIPKLYFAHINLPHIPYQYLPSGKTYPGGWQIPGLNLQTDFWDDNPHKLLESYRRYLLQVAFADNLVGQLLDRMQSLDIYDQALLVVVADHGVSFKLGSRRRDPPPMSNLDQDILPIPLFIKLPEQQEGLISDANVETIDILPSIAAALEISSDWQFDGRSLFGEAIPSRQRKTAYYHYRDFKRYQTTAHPNGLEQSLGWKLEHFTAGQGIAGIYRTGPYSALHGKALADVTLEQGQVGRYSLDNAMLYENLDPNSSLVPALVQGKLELPATLAGDQSLAISVNGSIQALTVVQVDTDGTASYSTMLPESSFIRGANKLGLFLLKDTSGLISLVRLDNNASDNDRTSFLLTKNSLSVATAGTEVVIPVFAPNRISGQLEQFNARDSHLEFYGWAMDIANKDEVMAVLVFDDGREIYRTNTVIMRVEAEELGAISAINVGFQFQLPNSMFQQPGSRSIRLIALSHDGYAGELGYPAGFVEN